MVKIDPKFNLEKFCFSLVFLIVLVIYSLTCSRYVTGGDSGELILVAFTNGVPHPPGYPLFSLLASLFGQIPMLTYAFRIAFFSSFCGAAAAGFISVSVCRLTRNVWAGFLAGFVFAFAPIVWASATVAEVFALNNLIIAALIYLTIRFFESPSEKFAAYTCLVFGLGLSNHHTVLFVGLPLMILIWRELKWKLNSFLRIIFWIFIGLLPYLYLPLATVFSNSVMVWGDLSNFSGFWHHLIRAEYGTFQLVSSHEEGGSYFLFNLMHFCGKIFKQSLGCLWVIPIGASVFLRGEKKVRRQGLIFYFCIVSLISYLLVFCFLSNLSPHDVVADDALNRFWQLPFLLLSACIGIGWAWLVSYVKAKWQQGL